MKYKQDPEMSNIARENNILRIMWDTRDELHDIKITKIVFKLQFIRYIFIWQIKY